MKSVSVLKGEITKAKNLQTELALDSKAMKDDTMAQLAKINDAASTIAKLESELDKVLKDTKNIAQTTFHEKVEEAIPKFIDVQEKKLVKMDGVVLRSVKFQGVIVVEYDENGKRTESWIPKGIKGASGGTKADPGEKDEERAKGIITHLNAQLSKTGKSGEPVVLNATKASDFARQLMAENLWPGDFAEINGTLEAVDKKGEKTSINHARFLRNAIKGGKVTGIDRLTVTRTSSTGAKTNTRFI